MVLSSGGMTARLDALADAGYIYRKPSPDDRRMVVIELTAKGRRVIDARDQDALRGGEVVAPAAERDRNDDAHRATAEVAGSGRGVMVAGYSGDAIAMRRSQ